MQSGFILTEWHHFDSWSQWEPPWYLGGCDVFPPFDLQQAQDVVGVGVDVLKPRGHPALLVSGGWDQIAKFKCNKGHAERKSAGIMRKKKHAIKKSSFNWVKKETENKVFPS